MLEMKSALFAKTVTQGCTYKVDAMLKCPFCGSDEDQSFRFTGPMKLFSCGTKELSGECKQSDPCRELCQHRNTGGIKHAPATSSISQLSIENGCIVAVITHYESEGKFRIIAAKGENVVTTDWSACNNEFAKFDVFRYHLKQTVDALGN